MRRETRREEERWQGEKERWEGREERETKTSNQVFLEANQNMLKEMFLEARQQMTQRKM